MEAKLFSEKSSQENKIFIDCSAEDRSSGAREFKRPMLTVRSEIGPYRRRSRRDCALLKICAPDPHRLQIWEKPNTLFQSSLLKPNFPAEPPPGRLANMLLENSVKTIDRHPELHLPG